MKFKNEIDEKQYKLLNLNEAIIRKRLSLADKILSKNRQRVKSMKDNWRRNKHKILKGLKKWHKSTQGKRFHRALGRFNALREKKIIKDFYESNKIQPVKINYDSITDALLSLSSIETHLLLELQYYEPNFDSFLQFLEIVENFMDDVYPIKIALVQAYKNGEIQSDIYISLIELIQLFLDPVMYLYIKRDQNGMNNNINQNPDLTEQLNKIQEYSNKNINLFDKIDEFFKN